jgi:drug/metabolite transporter, DME family
MNSSLAAPYRRGVALVGLAAVSWGTGGAVAAMLYRGTGLGPLAVSFWRFLFAFATLGAVQLGRRGRAGAGAGMSLRTAIPLGACLALSQTTYFAAVGQAGVAIGTVVTIGAGPLLVAAGEWLLLRERITARTSVVLGVALIGLAVLVVGLGVGRPSGPRPVLGIALSLVSAASYSMVSLAGRRARYGLGRAEPARRGTGMPLAFAAGCLALLPLALVEGLVPRAGSVLAAAGWLIYLGAVPSAAGYQLFFAGLALIPASTAAVVALVEPVAAAGIAVGLLGERLTGPTLAGSVVLLGAVALLPVLRSR